MKLPLFDSKPLYFAHRGRSAKAPENTMAAFRLAWDSGIRGIELDVRLCATGELVVFHDDTLRRITGAEGCIEDSSLEELKRLDAGGWFSDKYDGEHIPELGEVFESAPADAYFDIEIKPRGKNGKVIAKKIAQILSKHDNTISCIVSSFYPSAVRSARSAIGAGSSAFIYTADLAADQPAKLVIARIICRPGVLKPQWQAAIELLDRRTVAKPILPWTVNDPKIADECLSRGAAGIISDDPLELMRAGT